MEQESDTRGNLIFHVANVGGMPSHTTTAATHVRSEARPQLTCSVQPNWLSSTRSLMVSPLQYATNFITSSSITPKQSRARAARLGWQIFWHSICSSCEDRRRNHPGITAAVLCWAAGRAGAAAAGAPGAAGAGAAAAGAAAAVASGAATEGAAGVGSGSAAPDGSVEREEGQECVAAEEDGPAPAAASAAPTEAAPDADAPGAGYCNA